MKYSDVSFTWSGDVLSISSYAQYARAILEGLIKGGATVRLELTKPVKPPADLSPWWHETIQKCTKINPLYVKINHCEPTAASGNILGGPNILITHWPTLNFPSSWRQFINPNNFRTLFTTNPQALQDPALKACGVELDYLPMPIEKDTNPNDISEISDIKKNTFVFGSVGYWNQKSNFSDLIIAYTAEFSSMDNVALVIKTITKDHNPNNAAKLLQLVKTQKESVNKPDRPPIIVIQDQFTENALNAIIRRFNCYVSSKRGSSVDVSLAKCIGMGKPIVTSNVGISKMYVEEFKHLPKAIRSVPVTYEPVTMFDGGNAMDSWGRNDVQAMCKHMKNAYIESITNRKQVSEEINQMCSIAFDKFSVDNICDKLADKVRQLSPVALSL
jgi:hypothetical protein